MTCPKNMKIYTIIIMFDLNLFRNRFHFSKSTKFYLFLLNMFIYNIITIMFMWGQRICDPGPLFIRAQGPSRGGTLPRTHNESPNVLEI